MDVVVLAAGLGRRLGARTEVIPKCLVPVGGTPLLIRSLAQLNEHGFHRVIVVTGHLSNMVKVAVRDSGLGALVRFADNQAYRGTGTARSLCCASPLVETDHFLLLEADLLYSSQFLVRARQCSQTPTVFTATQSGSGDEVYVLTSQAGVPLEIAKKLSPEGLQKLYAGSARLSGELAGISVLPRSFIGQLESSFEASDFDQRDYESFLVEFSMHTAVHVCWLKDIPWTEIDNLADLTRARRYVWPRLVQEENSTTAHRREMLR